MLQHTNIDGMKDIRYYNSRQRDAFYIPEDAFWSCNCEIIQMLSCFPSHSLISLSWEYDLLEVQLIVSELSWRWIPCCERQFLCFAHGAMGLFDRLQVNVFEVVSHPFTDDRITLPHPTVHTNHNHSSVERAWRERKVSSKWFLETCRLWICCSYTAVVFNAL